MCCCCDNIVHLASLLPINSSSLNHSAFLQLRQNFIESFRVTEQGFLNVAFTSERSPLVRILPRSVVQLTEHFLIILHVIPHKAQKRLDVFFRNNRLTLCPYLFAVEVESR